MEDDTELEIKESSSLLNSHSRANVPTSMSSSSSNLY